MNCVKLNSDVTDWQPQVDETVLAEGVSYPYNDYLSGLNDNVLVVGGSGTGKTRGVVRPNLLQASGSYIVSDPKGNLYDTYATYLMARGYRVERLDFVHPMQSTVHYNLFHYLMDETDVYRVAHMLNEARPDTNGDQFWTYSAELLLVSMIAYLRETARKDEQNLARVLELIREGRRLECSSNDSKLDERMQQHAEYHPYTQATRAYESVHVAPVRTWNSICVSAVAKYGAYDTEELRELMRCDTMRLDTIGDTPTAIFVVVSDTDRSMDVLANLFFSQAMQVLCNEADRSQDSRLQIPVRFILDDFATNVRIDEFPRMISSIRSRGISAMLMIQAEAQLTAGYGRDAETIIGNCDTYVYLGGNDIETATRIGRRCDRPMLDILNMPLRRCWIFRRGQAALQAQAFDLEPFEDMRMAEVRTAMSRLEEPDTLWVEKHRAELEFLDSLCVDVVDDDEWIVEEEEDESTAKEEEGESTVKYEDEEMIVVDGGTAEVIEDEPIPDSPEAKKQSNQLDSLLGQTLRAGKAERVSGKRKILENKNNTDATDNTGDGDNHTADDGENAA